MESFNIMEIIYNKSLEEMLRSVTEIFSISNYISKKMNTKRLSYKSVTAPTYCNSGSKIVSHFNGIPPPLQYVAVWGAFAK